MSLDQETRRVRIGSLGWMIQRLARRLDDEMAPRLAAHDLTLQQFAVLMTALETDGLSQTEIGARFGMPAYAISRAIDHLEATGRLERRPHARSRRTLTVHATPAAHALAPALFAIVREVNSAFAAALSEDEQAELHALLARLV